MIERGGGRTSGLTDWHLMDVLSMWACLRDQDTTGQWKQVAGWRKVCDLALAHLGRLREYRRGLAEAWPPENNAAARAYIGELDQLIDKVQRTHDAAAANHDALAAATRAIGATRDDLKPIHEEFAAKLQQKRAYEAVLADPKAVAGSRLPAQPPVTDADLEQLNVKARSLMTGLSGELQQAQTMLRQPPPRPVPKVDEQAYQPGGDGLTPVIPSVIPVPLTPERGISNNRLLETSTPTTIPQAPAIGPILGGAPPSIAPTSVNPSAPSIQPGPTNHGGTRIDGSLTPIVRPPRTPFPPGALYRESPAGQLGPNKPTPPPSTSRPAPPGGLIGGSPNMGLGQPGGGLPPRRVNPVGGVIGGGAAGTTPTGAAGSRPGAGRYSQQGSIYPIGGSPTSTGNYLLDPHINHNQKASGGSHTEGWDAHDPWRTKEGVDPIVRAPEDEGPMDPGPAIGFSR